MPLLECFRYDFVAPVSAFKVTVHCDALGGITVRKFFGPILFIMFLHTIPHRHDFMFLVLPPMRFSNVASGWWPCMGFLHSFPL